jgi:hypothetical protein
MNRAYPHIGCSSLALAWFVGCHAAVLGQGKDCHAYPDHDATYLKRLYDPNRRQLEYGDDHPGGFDKWQRDARSALAVRIGWNKIAASAGDHQPLVELDEPVDLGILRENRV